MSMNAEYISKIKISRINISHQEKEDKQIDRSVGV